MKRVAIDPARELRQERFLESAACIPLHDLEHYRWLRRFAASAEKPEPCFLWFQRDLRLAAGLKPLPTQVGWRIDPRNRSERMEERRARVIELGLRGMDDEQIAAALSDGQRVVRAASVVAMRSQALRDGTPAREAPAELLPPPVLTPVMIGEDPERMFERCAENGWSLGVEHGRRMVERAERP